MTNAELWANLKIAIDQQSPDINEDEASFFLNLAQLMLGHQWADGYDTNEKHRYDLEPLLVKGTAAAAFIPSSSITGLFRILERFSGVFTFTDCNGNQSTITRPIVRLHSVNSDVAQHRDPFNKPSNEYPFWETDVVSNVSGISILSDSAPSAVTFYYIKRPTDIDVLNAPNATVELADRTGMEIVNKAMELVLLPLRDLQTWQAKIAENGGFDRFSK